MNAPREDQGTPHCTAQGCLWGSGGYQPLRQDLDQVMQKRRSLKVVNMYERRKETAETPKATERGNPAQILHEDPLMLNHTETEMALFLCV